MALRVRMESSGLLLYFFFFVSVCEFVCVSLFGYSETCIRLCIQVVVAQGSKIFFPFLFLFLFSFPTLLYKKFSMSLANNLRAVSDVFRRLGHHQLLLIASTLVVFKAKDLYWNTTKAHKTMETELSYLTAFTSSAPRHKDVHWLHHRYHMENTKMCSVTSESSLTSSRRVSPFQSLLHTFVFLHTSTPYEYLSLWCIGCVFLSCHIRVQGESAL